MLQYLSGTGRPSISLNFCSSCSRISHIRSHNEMRCVFQRVSHKCPKKTGNSHPVTNQHYNYQFSRLLLSVSGCLAKCHHTIPRSRRRLATIIFKTCRTYLKAWRHQVCKYIVHQQPHAYSSLKSRRQVQSPGGGRLSTSLLHYPDHTLIHTPIVVLATAKHPQ